MRYDIFKINKREGAKMNKIKIIVLILIINIGYVSVAQELPKFKRTIKDNEMSDKDFFHAKELVYKAELARGNSNSDFYYNMLIIDKVKDKVKATTKIKVNVKQDDDTRERSVLATVLDGSGAGNLILQKDTNMWFYKTGTANALRISPTQRLIGGASYADVSSTNYSIYYDPIAIKEVTLGKTTAHHISLSAIKKGVSYDSIEFFVSKNTQLPMKAEFYTRSGRLIKTMYFRKFKTLDGNKNFATEWVIVDSLYEGNVTTIQVLNIKPEKLAPSQYTPDGLLR